MMAKTVEHNLDGAQEIIKKHSQVIEVWKRFKRNKLAMVGLCIILAFVFIAVFANIIAPYDPEAADVAGRFQFPCLAHWFGTDNLGRDILSRIIYGGRVSLLVALGSLLISLLVGGVLGCVAGYFGGLCDTIIMRCMDIFMAIPNMLMAVCISAVLGTGMINTIIAVAVSGIAPAARLLRANVMSIRNQEYVESARAVGSSTFRTITHQIVPNTLSSVIVDSTLRIGGNIMAISMLSFIGLGVQAPTPEWGSLMNAGRDYYATFYPMVTFPGIAIMVCMFGFNVMGDGLRDALDPKLKN